MRTKLKIRIRKLDDGRFLVRYWWHWWEHVHNAYFENAQEVAEFLAKLVTNTKWE